MTTLSDQLRFLIEEGNVTSGQDAEFLRQTQVAAGRVSPVCICPLEDAQIDLIVGVAVFQVPDVLCECFRSLKESLWLLYLVLNSCSVIPM